MDDVYLDFDRLRLLSVGSKVHFSVHTYNTALNSTTVFHKCVTLGMSSFSFLFFFLFLCDTFKLILSFTTKISDYLDEGHFASVKKGESRDSPK